MLSAVAKKRGPGRPKHKDDPPVILATTIPKSLDRALREHAKVTGGHDPNIWRMPSVPT